MENISVRKAATEDAGVIVALVNAAYRPTPGSEGWTHEADLVTGSRIDLGQLLRVLESSTVLVAVRESQLVGCVQIQATGRESHIGMLAVLPSAQTAGLGKKLLVEAECYAKSNFGAERFVLLVVAGRRDLINFYVRRGYEETGEFQAYPIEAGVGTPVDPNARLAVLQKSSNKAQHGDR